jgi:GNAT superfamily N-acetyltransferase
VSVELRIVDDLTVEDLSSVRRLEQRTVARDGGRLKLEWATLEAGRVRRAALACEDSELLGFVGRYQFADATAELVGMVDPAMRRHGVGATLLHAMLAECAELGDSDVLLVVPRSSVDGRCLALAHGVYDHSEYAIGARL